MCPLLFAGVNTVMRFSATRSSSDFFIFFVKSIRAAGENLCKRAAFYHLNVFGNDDGIAFLYGDDSGATVERLFLDGNSVVKRNACAEVYVYKTGATAERAFADFFTIGKVELSESEFAAYAERRATAERAFADYGNALETDFFFCRDVFQSGATVERAFAYGDFFALDVNVFESGATVERVRENVVSFKVNGLYGSDAVESVRLNGAIRISFNGDFVFALFAFGGKNVFAVLVFVDFNRLFGGSDSTRNHNRFESGGDVISCGVARSPVVISLRAGSERRSGSRSEDVTEKFLCVCRADHIVGYVCRALHRADERKSYFLERGKVRERAEFDFFNVFADDEFFDERKTVDSVSRDFSYFFGNGYRFYGVLVIGFPVGIVGGESFRKFLVFLVRDEIFRAVRNGVAVKRNFAVRFSDIPRVFNRGIFLAVAVARRKRCEKSR